MVFGGGGLSYKLHSHGLPSRQDGSGLLCMLEVGTIRLQ